MSPASRRPVQRADVERALAQLDGLAATFLDGGFTSDGVFTPAAGEVAAVVDATHGAAACSSPTRCKPATAA
jgi:hypothetical protein